MVRLGRYRRNHLHPQRIEHELAGEIGEILPGDVGEHELLDDHAAARIPRLRAGNGGDADGLASSTVQRTGACPSTSTAGASEERTFAERHELRRKPCEDRCENGAPAHAECYAALGLN